MPHLKSKEIKMFKTLFILTCTLFTLSSCTDKKEPPKSMSSGMKCGAGKCGANAVNGNLILQKKKKNILSQMRSDDTRKTCVQNAKTTKAVYNCVRDKKTDRLSLKCGTAQQKSIQSIMKCAAGKCGAN